MTFLPAIPPATKLRAAADYLDGVPVKTICHDHGIKKTSVLKIMRRMGCPPRRPDLAAIVKDRLKVRRARVAAMIGGKQ